jgi:gluconolactonase
MRYEIETLATGLGHPEGPDVPPDGRIVMVETYTSKIIAWSPERGIHDYAVCGGGSDVCMMGADGRIYLTDPGGYFPDDRSTGRLFVLNQDGSGELLQEIPDAHPTGIVAEHNGSIVWVKSYDRCVYRRRPGGISELIQLLSENRLPNGPKIAADSSLWITAIMGGGAPMDGRLWRIPVGVTGTPLFRGKVGRDDFRL